MFSQSIDLRARRHAGWQPERDAAKARARFTYKIRERERADRAFRFDATLPPPRPEPTAIDINLDLMRDPESWIKFDPDFPEFALSPPSEPDFSDIEASYINALAPETPVSSISDVNAMPVSSVSSTPVLTPMPS